jgi:hypothetical protein
MTPENHLYTSMNERTDDMKKKTDIEAIRKSTTYIPMFTGRPQRETAINKEDIINLLIALGTCLDVNDFITQM